MENVIYHNRLTNLLFNTCSKVLRSLLPVLIRDYHGLFLNEFVKRKKWDIRRKPICQWNFKTLFPLKNEETDIQMWDISLLFCITEDILKPDLRVKQDVDMLRTIRNDLFHSLNTQIAQEKYEQILQNIREVSDRLLKCIDDDDFTQQIATETEEILNDKHHIDHAFELLDEWLETEKKQLEEGCTLTEDKRNILNYLRRLIISGRGQHIEIPDTRLVLSVQNCRKEDEISISKQFVDVINMKCGEHPVLLSLSDEQVQAISQMTEETFQEFLDEGQIIAKAELGCVILTVKSMTFESLERLWTKCINGEVTKAFNKLQSFLRETYQNEVEIEVMLPEVEFWKAINQIVNDLKTELPEGTTVELPESEDALEEICYEREANIVSSSVEIPKSDVLEVWSESQAYIGVTRPQRTSVEPIKLSGDTDVAEDKPTPPKRSCLEGKVLDVKQSTYDGGTDIEMVLRPGSLKQLEHMKNFSSSGKLGDSFRKLAEKLEKILNVKNLLIDAKFSVLETKEKMLSRSFEKISSSSPEIRLPRSFEKVSISSPDDGAFIYESSSDDEYCSYSPPSSYSARYTNPKPAETDSKNEKKRQKQKERKMRQKERQKMRKAKARQQQQQQQSYQQRQQQQQRFKTNYSDDINYQPPKSESVFTSSTDSVYFPVKEKMLSRSFEKISSSSPEIRLPSPFEKVSISSPEDDLSSCAASLAKKPGSKKTTGAAGTESVFTSSTDSVYFPVKDEVWKKALDQCYVDLVKDMNVNKVLDYFLAHDVIPALKCRDIQELKTSSDKKCMVLKEIQELGHTGYTKFKKCLRESSQRYLADKLEKKERIIMSKKEMSLSSSFEKVSLSSPAAVEQFRMKWESESKDGKPVTIKEGKLFLRDAFKYILEVDASSRLRVIIDEGQGTSSKGPDVKKFFKKIFDKSLQHESDMFSGLDRDMCCVPTDNLEAGSQKWFFALGKAIVLSQVHGGPKFQHLAEYVVQYVCGGKYEKHLNLVLVSDVDLVKLIHKMGRCTTQVDFKVCFKEVQEDYLQNSNWTEDILIEYCEKITRHLLKWYLVDKRKEALEQLKKGLNTLSFLDFMRPTPRALDILRHQRYGKVTAKKFRKSIEKSLKAMKVESDTQETARLSMLRFMDQMTDEDALMFAQFISGAEGQPVLRSHFDIQFNTADISQTAPLAEPAKHKLIIPLGNKTEKEFFSSIRKAILTPPETPE